jgi:DNA-directed RNA polymerase specialized sigma24 family protein
VSAESCGILSGGAYRLPEPIEQVGAWLYRVARNRIIDRFRKKKEVELPELSSEDEDEHWLDDMLPSPDKVDPSVKTIMHRV